MEKKSVLIIDDDKAVLASFRDLLEMKGYRVGTAENGREALEKANNNFYNLALIDIKLPDIEGTELLSEFRQIAPEMKRIMITGYSTREMVIESLNRGADGYLEKPVLPGKLLRFVADKLEEQETENRLYEETVNDLLRKKDHFLHNLDRWS
jgi:DNA-binding NtrC family response regulator